MDLNDYVKAIRIKATQQQLNEIELGMLELINNNKQLQAKIKRLKAIVDTQQGIVNFRTSYLETERKTVKNLQAENKRLREVIEETLQISDLWTLKEVETMFEDEAKALATMKSNLEQALKER